MGIVRNRAGVVLSSMLLLAWVAFIPPVVAQASYDYCQQSNKEALLFVDATNDWREDRADKEALLAGLNSIVASLEPGQRIRIVTIVDSHAKSRLLFNGCVPKCRETGFISKCRQLNANIEYQRFIERIARAILQLLDGPGTTQSAILLTLREWLTDKPSRDVFIFSDLIENSDLVSWRRDGYWEGKDGLIQFLESAGSKRYCGRLHGNSVWVFGFGRDHTKERHDLPGPLLVRATTAWQTFLRACGAVGVDIRNRLDAGR